METVWLQVCIGLLQAFRVVAQLVALKIYFSLTEEEQEFLYMNFEQGASLSYLALFLVAREYPFTFRYSRNFMSAVIKELKWKRDPSLKITRVHVKDLLRQGARFHQAEPPDFI